MSLGSRMQRSKEASSCHQCLEMIDRGLGREEEALEPWERLKGQKPVLAFELSCVELSWLGNVCSWPLPVNRAEMPAGEARGLATLGSLQIIIPPQPPLLNPGGSHKSKAGCL